MDGFLEKCIVGVWNKKSMFTCISIYQDKTHGQIQLEAFIIVDVGDEIQCMINLVDPPTSL